MAPQGHARSNQAQVPPEAKKQSYHLGELDADLLEDHGVMSPSIENCETLQQLCIVVYLAIPATSAPAERVFSGGTNVISDRRGWLDEDTIEAHVCLSDWG